VHLAYGPPRFMGKMGMKQMQQRSFGWLSTNELLLLQTGHTAPGQGWDFVRS
jgi:hypothetical protein